MCRARRADAGPPLIDVSLLPHTVCYNGGVAITARLLCRVAHGPRCESVLLLPCHAAQTAELPARGETARGQPAVRMRRRRHRLRLVHPIPETTFPPGQ